ncbi:MAG: NAD(P)-dependent oxidoreductase [Chitinophagaceae bacterium]|nr:NAD(P)-dependent oxidoreductase [Chitinophagaceae bacterium]
MGSNILKQIVADNELAIITRASSNLKRISSLAHQFRNYVLEQSDTDSIIQSFRPEVIIHCATDYGRKAVPQIQVIEANLILPLKLLHAAGQQGLQLFINTDTFLDKGINHYSLSKKQFNEWFHTYANDILCINMVLEHFYGPFDDKTKFVSFIINELLHNKPEIQLTPGTQKRNFIFIDDVVAAFQSILRHNFKQSSGFFDFFVASERTISIRDLVVQLQLLCGNEQTRLNFGALPFRPNEVMDSSVDISAMKSLGWAPKVDLEEGLRYTIEMEKHTKH